MDVVVDLKQFNKMCFYNTVLDNNNKILIPSGQILFIDCVIARDDLGSPSRIISYERYVVCVTQKMRLTLPKKI